MIDVAESGIFREGTTGGCQWRVRGLIQSETLRRTSHPHWVSPDCRWRWPVEHPHQLVGLRWMCRCRTLQCITNSSSVRKKFPTSVCRHSTSSTGKTLQHLWLDLNKLLGAAGVDVGAADAASALADAVGEAAGAAGAVVAAAIAGDVAAGSRRDFLNRPSAIMTRSARRIEALLLARAPASPLIVALDHSNNKCTQSADRQHRERRSSSAGVRRTRAAGSGEMWRACGQVAPAIAPTSPQALRAFRLAPRSTPSPRPNTRPTATPKGPNALQHHSGQRQRLGDSSATRHKDDEGEDFRGPLWQCTTLVACASGRVVAPN